MRGASAPGKAILAGEHAAVYGRPALVAALDARLVVRIETRSEVDSSTEGLRLVLPSLGVDETLGWDDLVAYAEDRRRAWDAWFADRDARDFTEVQGDDPAHLVKVAVGEALAHAVEQGRQPPAGATLRAESTIPAGSGFGSSAAASAACVAAILALCGIDAEPDTIEALALDAERRQHGTPSGVDTATVLRGGVVWVERVSSEKGGEGKLSIEPVDLAADSWLDRVRLVHTGTPAESTGRVVAAVRRRRADDPADFERRLDEVADSTANLRRLLAEGALDAREPIRAIHCHLLSWSVVPEPVAAFVERVEAEGGAAKISGAGSVAGPGAGSLLVHHPDRDGLETLTSRLPPGWQRLDFGFGGTGLRIGRGPGIIAPP